MCRFCQFPELRFLRLPVWQLLVLIPAPSLTNSFVPVQVFDPAILGAVLGSVTRVAAMSVETGLQTLVTELGQRLEPLKVSQLILTPILLLYLRNTIVHCFEDTVRFATADIVFQERKDCGLKATVT